METGQGFEELSKVLAVKHFIFKITSLSTIISTHTKLIISRLLKTHLVYMRCIAIYTINGKFLR